MPMPKQLSTRFAAELFKAVVSCWVMLEDTR
jgi:hypothetical protein